MSAVAAACPAANTGPKVRSIAWEALQDVGDTIWKNSTNMSNNILKVREVPPLPARARARLQAPAAPPILLRHCDAPTLPLQSMFPDLKEMFTEKQVVKKPAGAAAGGDGTGEGGEGGEKKPEKLKPIQFMNDVDSKKVSTVWCGFVHTPPSPAGAHLVAVASSGS